jgi:hypothetical protein
MRQTISAGAILLLMACGDDSTPTMPPPTVSLVTTTSVEIVGPRSIAPGQTIQFTAIAHRSDGTTLDVTSSAVWRCFPESAMSISATGLATGRALGESVIQVVSSNRVSSKEIVIVPTGTYRLVGLVGEVDVPTAPVVGARVEVTGPTAVPFAITDAGGRYRLYGVPSGNVELRLSKDGYEPTIATVAVSDHQTQNFTLTLRFPRAGVAGTYTLTISAAGDCAATLPVEARIRTYMAVLTQVGPQVDVSVAGAMFALNTNGRGNRFRGRIEPGQVVFTLNPYHPDFYYYSYGGYADLAEQLGSSSYLFINGIVATSITTSRLEGRLDGSFVMYSRDPRLQPRPGASIGCSSTNHQFALWR